MATTERRRPLRFAFLLWALLATFVVMECMLCSQNFVRSGPSKTSGIVNNLRQLEGAKQQWAQDHKPTNAVEITQQDLTPYFSFPPNKGWVTPVAGERYTLKSLGESPVAELTREVDGRPKGTLLRLGTNGELEIVLPGQPRQGTGAGHSATATNRPASGPTRP